MQTKKFATKCFPLIKYIQTGDSRKPQRVFRQKRDNTDRSGRIDVAVMKDGSGDEQPVCAIEVKRLNPSDKLVRKDLKRNAAHFALRNQIGERPLLEFAAFATLHRYRPGYREEDIRKECKLYKQRTLRIALPTGVTSEVQVFQVHRQEEPDYNFGADEVDQDAYQILGIIIILHWAEHVDR